MKPTKELSARGIDNAREIRNCDNPSSPRGCCSWRQSCCGGGCCEPMPNCCSSKKDNVKPSQKATSASTYGYTPLEMAMNMLHETIKCKPLGFQQTIAKKKVLCSNISKEMCYGGECGETLNKDSSTRNIGKENKENEKKENDLVESTIRLSER